MSERLEIYRNFNFEIVNGGFARAGFSAIRGLRRTTESIEYREGGDLARPRQLIAQTKFEDIVLERGMSTDSDFINWCKLVQNLEATENDQTSEAEGSSSSLRRNFEIYLRSKSGAHVHEWKVFEAWPSVYETDDFDASGNAVLITKLTLKHEGWYDRVLTE